MPTEQPFAGITGCYRGAQPEIWGLYDADTDELFYVVNDERYHEKDFAAWCKRHGDVWWDLHPGFEDIPFSVHCAECGVGLSEVDYLCKECRG